MDKLAIYLALHGALVLSKFLSRCLNGERLNIKDQAGQRALWDLTCFFEKTLAK